MLSGHLTSTMKQVSVSMGSGISGYDSGYTMLLCHQITMLLQLVYDVFGSMEVW